MPVYTVEIIRKTKVKVTAKSKSKAMTAAKEMYEGGDACASMGDAEYRIVPKLGPSISTHDHIPIAHDVLRIESDLVAMLRSQDWNYARSDDKSVYYDGRANRGALENAFEIYSRHAGIEKAVQVWNDNVPADCARQVPPGGAS